MSLLDDILAKVGAIIPEADTDGLTEISLHLLKLLQETKGTLLDEIREMRSEGRYAIQMLLMGEMQPLSYCTFKEMQPMMLEKHKQLLEQKGILGVFGVVQVAGRNSLLIKVFTFDDQRTLKGQKPGKHPRE